MESTRVNIHISAEKFKARFLQKLAELIGATVTVEEADTVSLSQLIEKGEKDLADGKGVTLTLDELRAMTHEVA